MTGRVTIPAELAAEVAAHPERFRPDIDEETPALVLGCANAPYAIGIDHRGLVGPAAHSWRDARTAGVGTLTVGIDDAEVDSCEATAWALVGSVDAGPRPEVGDRVLVLDHPHDQKYRPEGVCVVAVVREARGRLVVGVESDDEGWWPLIRRWALLPPPVSPQPETVPQDAGGESVPGETVSPNPLRDTRVVFPEELVAEVVTHPERFRSRPMPGGDVLVLDCRGGLDWAGYMWRAGLDDSSPLAAGVTAWVPVGSVDGGPRPGVGDRVLVLEVSKGYPDVLVGRVGEVAGEAPVYVRIPSAEVACYITRWALLPPAPVPRRSLVENLHDGRPVEPYVPSPARCPQCQGARPARINTENGPEMCGHPWHFTGGMSFVPLEQETAPDGTRVIKKVRLIDYGPHPHCIGSIESTAYREPGHRPWRLGQTWTTLGGALTTVVETGAGDPDENGRREGDRLVGSMLKADARRVVAAVEDAAAMRTMTTRLAEAVAERDEARADRDGLAAENTRLREVLEHIREVASDTRDEPLPRSLPAQLRSVATLASDALEGS